MKNIQIAYGIAIAAMIAVFACLGYHFSPRGSGMETFFFALGGKMPDGLIQFASFACFFICLFGIQSVWKRIAYEEKTYGARLLPETEQYVLYAEDVNRIKLETIEAERRMGPSMLTDLIKQATTKFRANSSTSEALAMVETVSEMQRKNMEKEFWLIQICTTLIPAFGFLGTVWGMAAAILNMGQPSPTVSVSGKPVVSQGPDFQALIDSMGTAFFTTIVAIVLGIVVSILTKRLESKVEDLHTGMKRYVVENLVNRIHL